MAYNKTYEKKEERDHQQEITDRIIARLKEAEECLDKGLSWEKPFFECNEWPINGFTGERYRGGNVVALLSEEKSDPRWFTFIQIQELSKQLDQPLSLEKGSRASYVMKVVPAYQKGEDGSIKKDSQGNPLPVLDDNGKPKIGFRWYPVFNGENIKGLAPYIKPNQGVEPHEAVQMLAEALQERTGLVIEHSRTTQAYYSPKEDKVHMPLPELFKSTQAYHDTLLHELGHATGKHLGREQTGKFGSKEYAFEELVAELNSAFMSVELGLPHNPSSHENQAAYIKSWLKALQDDKTLITKAGNQASKATEFQMTHFNEYKQDLELRQSSQQKEEQKLEQQPKKQAKAMSM